MIILTTTPRSYPVDANGFLKQKDAQKFQDEREKDINGELPMSRGVTTPMQHIADLKNFLADPETMDAYLQVLEESSISVTSDRVRITFYARTA